MKDKKDYIFDKAKRNKKHLFVQNLEFHFKILRVCRQENWISYSNLEQH